MSDKQAAPVTSIDRAPLDHAHLEDDGDNSIHSAQFPAHVKKLAASAETASPSGAGRR